MRERGCCVCVGLSAGPSVYLSAAYVLASLSSMLVVRMRECQEKK